MKGKIMTEFIIPEHAQTQSGFLNHDFRTCLAQLMAFGIEAHPRGTTTKELINYNITLLDPRNRLITFPARNTNMKYLLGELIWYFSGSNEPDGILPYSKFWANITNSGEVDGYPQGTVNSNYGNRLFGLSELDSFWSGATPVNQWKETVELLKRDKDTRQAVMNIHVPTDRHIGNRDVCCTLTLQWFIRASSLHLIVSMRSNDAVLGFTNDVFQFTMLQECMLLQLKEAYPELELGHYYHNTGSMHIYQRHFEMAEAIIADTRAVDMSMAPMDRFDDEICTALIACEAAWQKAEQPINFDFTKVAQWEHLTPYWRNLLLGMFLNEDEALHAIFGLEEHEAN